MAILHWLWHRRPDKVTTQQGTTDVVLTIITLEPQLFTLASTFQVNFGENAGFPQCSVNPCPMKVSRVVNGLWEEERGVYGSLPAAEAKQVAMLMTMNRQHRWPNFFMSDNTIWLHAPFYLF